MSNCLIYGMLILTNFNRNVTQRILALAPHRVLLIIAILVRLAILFLKYVWLRPTQINHNSGLLVFSVRIIFNSKNMQIRVVEFLGKLWDGNRKMKTLCYYMCRVIAQYCVVRWLLLVLRRQRPEDRKRSGKGFGVWTVLATE